MPGMLSEVARGGGLYVAMGSEVGAGVGVAAGAVSLPADVFGGVCLLVRAQPPTPAVTAVAAVTPLTVRNLRRSKLVIMPSCGCCRAFAVAPGLSGVFGTGLTPASATAAPR